MSVSLLLLLLRCLKLRLLLFFRDKSLGLSFSQLVVLSRRNFVGDEINLRLLKLLLQLKWLLVVVVKFADDAMMARLMARCSDVKDDDDDDEPVVVTRLSGNDSLSRPKFMLSSSSHTSINESVDERGDWC